MVPLQLPHPLLKTPCHLVSTETQGLQVFIDELLHVMDASPHCVGVAANQLGQPWRVAVINAARLDRPGTRHGLQVLLNPYLIEQRGQTLSREGCLRVPDYTGNVLRATSVRLLAKSRAWQDVEILAEGFEAIVLQHELDHLEGKLFLDRVASLETDVFRRKRYL